VRQLPRDGVPESSCTPAASAPALGAVIGLQDPARQDRAIGLQTLADHDQAELIQAAERGQVRAAEGSVRHVEVFLANLEPLRDLSYEPPQAMDRGRLGRRTKT
jgi:hypothetical protein